MDQSKVELRPRKPRRNFLREAVAQALTQKLKSIQQVEYPSTYRS